MKTKIFGDPESKTVIVQFVDEHDLSLMEAEALAVEEGIGHKDWAILAVLVENWNDDLSPWKAAPVFGTQEFGGGAAGTLQKLLETILPEYEKAYPRGDRSYYLCGYSLAGLFALWAGYQTDRFSGIVAASPSVWYEGWLSYVREHSLLAKSVYLSLGDKEEKTRNPVMARVGDALREYHGILESEDIETILESNPGNHFVDSEKRVAKGIAWMINGRF